MKIIQKTWFPAVLISGLMVFTYCNDTTSESKNTVIATTKDSISTENYLPYTPIEDTLLVIDSIAGLLNNDELLDYILVCRSINESETEYDEYDRKSFIYLGQANGVYNQHSSNVGAVLCKNCGGIFGDPFETITIEPGNQFSISHYGGSNYRWSILSKFNYDSIADNWVLQSVENSSFTTFEPDNVETVVFTKEKFGTVYFQDFDVNEHRE